MYYNAAHPLEIMDSLTILTSKVNGRDRGVSFSLVPIDCHGPFTFHFVQSDWFKQFTPVQYGNWGQIDFLRKPLIFENEQELWSRKPVHFSYHDVISITFRKNSPGARIHPIKSKRIAKELKKRFEKLYREA